VAAVVEGSLGALERAGAVIETVDVRLPADQFDLSLLWSRLMGALYADSLTGLVEEGYDLMGKHIGELTPAFRDMVLSAQRQSALQTREDERLRSAVLDSIEDAFDGFDFLVTPTLAVTAVENRTDGLTTGPTTVGGVTVDPSIGWCLTYPFNFTGHPAASLPAGFIDGLPVGLQLVGRRHDDVGLLAASAAFEQQSPWLFSYPA
jgi:amidase/aspartyl-tRNA(Asn)/glutamyl-tRNA(Gln) amidotransferase subunit A